MPVSPELLGRLLATGISGYAGAAAGALLERHAAIADRIGPGAFDLWKQHFEDRLSELATALTFSQPELFATGSVWTRAAFEARGVVQEPFAAGLEALETELAERLPDGSAVLLARYFDAARGSLERPAAQPTELAGGDRSALEFLRHALDGDTSEAVDILLAAHREGVPVADIFDRIVVQAQREVGGLWHRGEINVAEEHLATLTTQNAIAVLGHHARSESPNGKTVVITSVAGDHHDLGLRLIAELFRIAGWRSVPLGADVPRIDLLQALDAFDADLLVMSATLVRHLLAIRATIESVRARTPKRDLAILVGGRAFGHLPDLWSAVGADGWAASLREAVAEGERLVAGR